MSLSPKGPKSARSAKDLLNNRMAYVAVSRGAQDAQLFTNDREGLGMALGRDVSHRSALVPDAPLPQQEVVPRIERNIGFSIGL